MALITRCPACGTMFKVVPDQLRISEGWVRCGHCAEIFDASAHLQESAETAASHQSPGSAAAPLAELVSEEELQSVSPQERDSSLQFAADSSLPDSGLPSAPDSVIESALPSAMESQIDDGVTVDEPDPAELDAQARALREDPLDRPFELRREDLGPHSESAESALPSSQDDDEPLDDLGFVRQARRQARWRHPRVRIALSLALLALGLLLAGQVAVHERNRLAASQPALRPWLAQLCQALDCRIRAPRRIEAIAIDSSSFNKLRPDTYRLQVTLKNQGSTEVAMPALELTLTDSQEQAVVRRVLLPSDLGANRTALAGATEWSGAVAFALADNSLGSRIAGYRLLAFYP